MGQADGGRPFLGLSVIFFSKGQQLPAVLKAFFHAKCAFLTFGASP